MTAALKSPRSNALASTTLTLVDRKAFLDQIDAPPLDAIRLSYSTDDDARQIRQAARDALNCGPSELQQLSYFRQGNRILETIGVDPRYRLYMCDLMAAISEKAGEVALSHKKTSTTGACPLLRVAVRVEDGPESAFILRFRDTFDQAGHAFYDACIDKPEPLTWVDLEVSQPCVTYLNAVELLTLDARYKHWASTFFERYRLPEARRVATDCDLLC